MKYRNLLLIVLVVLVVGGVTAIVNSSRKSDGQNTQTEGEANVTAQNVSFTITEGEVKKWIISAQSAEYFQDRTGAKLKDIKGEVFDDEGKVIVEFHAPTGEYINENNQVKLTGGVSATTTDKENPVTVNAPTMRWSARGDQVVAEGGVKLAHQLFGESQAQRCRFNLDLTAISLEGGVVTSITKL